MFHLQFCLTLLLLFLSFVSTFTFLSDLAYLVIFASFSRGQPPARYTKVVDDDLRPLKPGQTHLSVPVCANYVTSPNPTTPGRDVVDVHAHTATSDCIVCNCGSVRCKTCKQICRGSTFVSNVTSKMYNVLESS